MNDNAAPIEGISIVQAVAQSREAVFEIVMAVTGGDIDFLGYIPEILAVLQSIPPQLLEDIGVATLQDFTTRRGVPLDGEESREYLIAFDKVLAANIAASINFVMQNIREQQAREHESQRRLQSGLLAAR